MKLTVSFDPQKLNATAEARSLNITTGNPIAKGDKGDKGDDGLTPVVEITPIPSGHNVAFDYGEGDPRNTDFDVLDGVSDNNDIADIRAKQTLAPNADTRRANNGTEILNPLWLDKAAIQYGCSLFSNGIYAYVMCVYTGDNNHKTFVMMEKNSQNAPYEFTLENAPSVVEITSNRVYYNSRLRISQATVADVRLCHVIYDENWQEIERIYSAQYRYVNDNGVITRSSVGTQNTSRNHIIDLGLVPNDGSITEQYNYITDENLLVAPVTSDYYLQKAGLHIPDSMFENVNNGLGLVAKRGDGVWYKIANVYKAEEPIDISQYRTASEQDVIDTNQSTTLYNYVNTEISSLDAEDVGLTEITAVEIAAILQS